MGRFSKAALGAAALACLTVGLAGVTAGASASGGGATRWSASYGDTAYAHAVELSPDGSAVFVTGTSEFGPDGDAATVAFDAASGERRWAALFPVADNDGRGWGHALTTSPHGNTVFVTGWIGCSGGCSAGTDELFTVAYKASNGDRLWTARYAADAGTGMSIVPSPDGTTVYVNGQTHGGLRNVTLAYAASSGKRLWAAPSAGRAVAQGGGALAVTSDGDTVLVASSLPGGEERCYNSGGYRTAALDAADGTVRWSATHEIEGGYFCGQATGLRLSPDGSDVYVTGYGGDYGGSGGAGYAASTVVYDVSTGDEQWTVRDGDIRTLDGDVVVALEVSGDGSKVFVSGSDCHDYPSCPIATIAHDAATGDQLWVSRYDGGGSNYVADIEVAPNSSSVYMTGQETLPCYTPCDNSQINGPLVAYDASTGAERWATSYPDNIGQALAASPDGSSLYLAGTFTAASSVPGRAATGFERPAAKPACSSYCGYSTTRFSTRLGAGTFQETDPTVTYGGWANTYDATALGGAYRASHTRGSTATFTTPSVKSFAWHTHTGPDQGEARVTIDGHRSQVVDLYSPKPATRTITFDGLTARPHTVRVRVLGKKNAASRGMWVALDAFTYKRGVGLTQESSPEVRYDTWAGTSRGQKSARTSGSAAAAISFEFKGGSVTWVTATGPAAGRARVVVDGKPRTVDLYRPGATGRATYTYGSLSNGTHRITIRPLGTKNTASTSTRVTVDAFIVHKGR